MCNYTARASARSEKALAGPRTRTFLPPSGHPFRPTAGTMSSTDVVAGGRAEGPTRGKTTAVANELSVDSPWLEDQERDTARHARLVLSTAAALTAHAPVAQRIERRFPVP